MVQPSLFILIVCFFIAENNFSQCTLTIRQTGVISDTVFVANYDETQQPKHINDSTLEFICNPSPPDRIFIVIDRKTKWHTRVWMEPAIKGKELIINYSKKTVTLKNPSSWDTITQKWSKLLNSKKQTESDSVAMDFINKNPNSYLSLYFISHGLYRDNQTKKMWALNKLDSAFKEYPEYKQTKAGLLERKYPKTGDSFKEFEFLDKNDSIYKSTTINSKWILLHFWSNSCAPCIKEMDELVNLYKSIDTSKIEFIAVALDENKKIWKNSKSNTKILWPSVWQPDNIYGELCLYYNLTAMPFFVLFDSEKKIYYIKDGANELENIKITFKGQNLLK